MLKIRRGARARRWRAGMFRAGSPVWTGRRLGYPWSNRSARVQRLAAANRADPRPDADARSGRTPLSGLAAWNVRGGHAVDGGRTRSVEKQLRSRRVNDHVGPL